MPGTDPSHVRKLYVVLSARSLPYARACLGSLLRNAAETLDVTLITDGLEDKTALEEAMAALGADGRHQWRVFDKADADRRAETLLAGFPAIRAFREGHPCWRKITDPPLFASSGEEMVILDPDVYFPNRFTFEPTPETGILLMRQRPNCLLPEETVRQAFEAGLAMADHTDIGVAQLKAPFGWGVLEHLLQTMGVEGMPRSMHVESIVWAQLAMLWGGGYLDPVAWRCFDNSVFSRLRRRAGRSGVDTLRALDVDALKCLHAGGIAKNWLPDAEAAGLFATPSDRKTDTAVQPFVPFGRSKFERKFANRRLARKLGLYALMGSE